MCIHPQPDWRPLTTEELGLLIGEDAEASDEAADLPPLAAGLLVIPTRLRQAWWETAGHGMPVAARDERYQRFAASVLEFLRFKRLPLPPQCEVEALASRPDQPGTRVDPATGRLSGLRFAAPDLEDGRRPVGVINLGDEATHLVLLNLSSDIMRGFLAREGDPTAWCLAPAPLTERFFDACSSYPLVRLRLEPGEGLWFPQTDVVYDGWPGLKREVDIVLTIHGDWSAPTPAPRST